MIARVRKLAQRIDAATPPSRDRAVDALRALAIAGVIGGHWLVTALVVGRGGKLSDQSPIASMHYLAPLSWIFQTLAVFFLVGGYSAARSYRGGYRAWLGRRMARITRPVLALAAVWIPVTAALSLAGVSEPNVRTLLTLVISPLWFLCVYAGLTALTPAAMWLVRRFGAWAAAFPAAVVAVADLVRFGLSGPAWVGWVNIAAGWLVPYLLGIAWASGGLRGRRVPALMLAGGVAATAALIAWAGYPASMVGVNGARISNLNPPTLAAVTFGIAQCGLALLVREPLARWMRRPLAWAGVAMVNLSAMTLFLWHQTAFVAVSSAGRAIGRVPGLLTAPGSPLWVAERLAWLPVFAAVLSVLWLAFHRIERGAPQSRGTTRRRGAGAPSPASAGRVPPGQVAGRHGDAGSGPGAGPAAGGGGFGDGDGDGRHQVGVAGAGGAGQLNGARGVDGEHQTAVGQRPGQPGRGRRVLTTAVASGQDVPHRGAQAEQGGVLGVRQPGLGGQQRRRAEPSGGLLAAAQGIGVRVSAHRADERLD